MTVVQCQQPNLCHRPMQILSAGFYGHLRPELQNFAVATAAVRKFDSSNQSSHLEALGDGHGDLRCAHEDTLDRSPYLQRHTREPRSQRLPKSGQTIADGNIYCGWTKIRKKSMIQRKSLVRSQEKRGRNYTTAHPNLCSSLFASGTCRRLSIALMPRQCLEMQRIVSQTLFVRALHRSQAIWVRRKP